MPTYPDISKITLPSGSTYNLKDQTARELIAQLQENAVFMGVTTTALTEGSTTNPITINGEPVTARTGDWTITDDEKKEFIFNGTFWQEFGDMSDLGSLAYKDSASGTVDDYVTAGSGSFTGTAATIEGTPEGDVSSSFTGTALTSTGTLTPTGTVSTPTITITPTNTTVNSITDVGTLPSATMPTYTVAEETLTITAGSFSAGTLPTKGADTTVVASATATSSQPTFTGEQANVSVTGTPEGSVSSTFTGDQFSINYTPTGSVDVTLTKGNKTITVS